MIARLIPRPHQQQGNALLLSIFIIVVMTLIGTAIVRVISTGSESVAVEVLGTRAYSAAQTGLEIKLSEIFPLGQPATACSATGETSTVNLNAIVGFTDCTVEVTCTQYAQEDFESGGSILFNRLVAIGECGVNGPVPVSRLIQVEARSL